MSITCNKGTFYLIPVPLGEINPVEVLPESTLIVARRISCFIAENAKSARRFLKAAGTSYPLQEINIMEIDKHQSKIDYDYYFADLRSGKDAGLVSEAGIPAVADPGSAFVQQAHRESIRVVPLTGPSSILLALAASGLNGQSFVFHGYLPKELEARKVKIRAMELQVKKIRETQIFIETPYRNTALLNDLLQTCSDSTLLCIATDITLPSEEILTLPIAEWKRRKINIDKRPTIFLIG